MLLDPSLGGKGERACFLLFPRELARFLVVSVRESRPVPDSQEKDKSDGGCHQISLHSQLPMARYGPCQRERGGPEPVWILPRGLLPEGKGRTMESVCDNSHHLGPLCHSPDVDIHLFLSTWVPIPTQGIRIQLPPQSYCPSPAKAVCNVGSGRGERKRLLSCWQRVDLRLNQVQKWDENLRLHILMC